MTFLSPALLWGLAAAGLPIAIHLLNKTRIREVRWAAMRFLRESVKRNERRMRIEDLLLLLLRCLVIALLVLAFARPALLGRGPAALRAQGPLTAVLILDNSASMGQSDGFETRFSQAKRRAEELIEQLGPGSVYAVFLASDGVDRVIPRPTTDIPLVRRYIANAPLSAGGSDLLAAVEAAYQTLEPIVGEKREIYVLTDNQALAWRNLAKIEELAKAHPDIPLRVLAMGEKGEANVAITSVRLAAAVPSANLPHTATIEVTNTGAEPVEGQRMTLAIDSRPPSAEAFIDRIEPGRTETAEVTVQFAEPGFHTLQAVIPPDRHPADNERSLAVQVVDQLRVLLVESDPSKAKKAERDVFYLANALVPFRRDHAARHYLQVSTAAEARLREGSLDDFDLIIVANPAPFDAATLGLLRQYVNAGGSLVVFPGPRTTPDLWAADRDEPPLAPAALGPKEKAPAGSGGWAWQARDFRHPVFEIWNQPELGGLGSLRAQERTLLKAEESGDSPAVVMARFADGAPAAVEKRLGRGSVVMFASSATPEWNNLPIHPAFVPMVQRLVAHLTSHRRSDLALKPGEAFRASVDMELLGRDVYVMAPGEEGRRLAGKVELRDNVPTVTYTDTAKAGAYVLFADGREHPVAAFAVQSDPEEADLRTIDAGRLAALEVPAGAAEPAASEAADAAAPVFGGSFAEREFWLPLLVLAGVLSLAEMMLAHRFSQTR